MNQKNIFKFYFNEVDCFFIKLNNPHDAIDCCYQAPMILCKTENQYCIGNEDIQEYVERLQKLLAQALSNLLKLDYSVVHDLGYQWNQDMNEENPNLSYQEEDDIKHWIGTKYLLWTTSNQSPQQFGSWLYNDTFGNIIFEVTPIYPGTFVNRENSQEVQAYQEWMEKKYKPFFTRTISRDVGIQWLDQANLILQTISDNVKMLEEKYKNENEE